MSAKAENGAEAKRETIADVRAQLRESEDRLHVARRERASVEARSERAISILSWASLLVSLAGLAISLALAKLERRAKP